MAAASAYGVRLPHGDGRRNVRLPLWRLRRDDLYDRALAAHLNARFLGASSLEIGEQPFEQRLRLLAFLALHAHRQLYRMAGFQQFSTWRNFVS